MNSYKLPDGHLAHHDILHLFNIKLTKIKLLKLIKGFISKKILMVFPRNSRKQGLLIVIHCPNINN
jgi:hypothetical protein